MSEAPIYTSPSSVKSFWHHYRIYADRLELETGLGVMKVPFEHIQGVEISPPIATAEGIRLHVHPLKFGIKLDWADVTEHIMIDKDTGLFHRVDFTPDDPPAFHAALTAAIARFREQKAAGSA